MGLRAGGPTPDLVLDLPVVATASLALGAFLAKLVFYVHWRRPLVAGTFAAVTSLLAYGGAVFGAGAVPGWSPAADVAATLGAWASAAVIVSLLAKRVTWIRLFTDAVTVGGRVIPYAECVHVKFAVGEEIARYLPPAGRDLPVRVLTPLEHEFESRDLSIYHYYAILTTGDANYVLQSLTHKSSFVANVRNGWACFDYARRQAAGEDAGE